MKLTFLDPCDYNFYNNQTSGPLGLAYIASYLEKEFGSEVEVNIEVDVDTVLRQKPDIVGISAYTETFSRGMAAARKIKENLNIPVLIGGKHITALPSNLNSYFDAGIIGDGEITTAELIGSYIENKRFLPEELAKIKNLAFRDGQNLIMTPQREPLRNMDELPPPKREIMKAWFPSHSKIWHWPQGLYTSRGCPYKCPFCIHSKIKFVSRYNSPERVVQEISEIVSKFPEQRHINIHDDLFTISKKRLSEIVELIVSEKLHRKVSFTCMCKSNLFDDDIAYMLKRMNVRLITFGFESGDETTLQYLKKDSSKIVENIKAIDYCNKYGIHCGGYFILGSPPETVSGLQKTYWFIRENFPPMSLVGTFCLTPFPGTKTWDLAVEKGLVNENAENWENYNYLMYESHNGLLLNDNYDPQFFKSVFESYFKQLNEKNTVFAVNDQRETDRLYYDEIFRNLKNYNIKAGNKILEIGTYFLHSIKELFAEEKEITRFDHWNLLTSGGGYETLQEKRFDIITFNHSLEQMLNPYRELETLVANNLEDKGKVIIIVKNPQFIGNIANLLTNTWEIKTAGFKKFDNFHRLNIEKLIKKLKSLDLQIKAKIPVNADINPYPQVYQLLSLLAPQVALNKFLPNSNALGYLIIAER